MHLIYPFLLGSSLLAITSCQASAYYGGFVPKMKRLRAASSAPYPTAQLNSGGELPMQTFMRRALYDDSSLGGFGLEDAFNGGLAPQATDDYADEQDIIEPQPASSNGNSYGGGNSARQGTKGGSQSSYGGGSSRQQTRSYGSPAQQSKKAKPQQRKGGYGGQQSSGGYGGAAQQSSGGYGGSSQQQSSYGGSKGGSQSSYGGSQGGYGGQQQQQEEDAYEAPMPYSFKYGIDDGYGTTQDREEVKDSYGNVKGSYGYMDANGIYRKVEYTAGKEGFRAVVSSNEPGLGTTDNPADTVFNVRDPPPGSYGSRKSGYSGGASSGGYSGSQSSSYGGSSSSSGSYGGSSGATKGGYGGSQQQQQLQGDYSHNLITKIAHKAAVLNSAAKRA